MLADRPVDLAWTIGTLRHLGLGDPGIRFVGKREVHRAAWTPEGPSTLRIQQGETGYDCEAWGPGAAWELERLEGLLGLDAGPLLEPGEEAGEAHGAIFAAACWRSGGHSPFRAK